jgi:hypothetical protein
MRKDQPLIRAQMRGKRPVKGHVKASAIHTVKGRKGKIPLFATYLTLHRLSQEKLQALCRRAQGHIDLFSYCHVATFDDEAMKGWRARQCDDMLRLRRSKSSPAINLRAAVQDLPG